MSAGGSSRRWVLDPIDGTANFVRGVPVWATLIGLEVDGVMKVGVVSAPALGRRWWAERGKGAFAGRPGNSGERIKVSELRGWPTPPSRPGAWPIFPTKQPFCN